MSLLQAAADQGRLLLDVVAYPTWLAIDSVLAGDGTALGEYRSRLKIGGVKLTLDGSPQGKTAYLTQPYQVPPPGQGAQYRGYPAMPDEEVQRWVDSFFARDLQVLAHANGDAAADQLLDAVARAGERHGSEDRRTVMIHAQTVREDQLDRMLRLGVVPSFFVAHAYYWGDWHRDSVLGPGRAARISPARSALDRGLHFTLHNDAPIVPPDVLRLVWAGVARRTRSGTVLGPEQRITVPEALRAVTIEAAYQHFEEDRKGSIEAGKLADLVILSESPLAVAPQRLLELEVVATYKEGRLVAGGGG